MGNTVFAVFMNKGRIYKQQIDPVSRRNGYKRIKHFEDCISLDFGDNFHPQDLAFDFPGDFPGIRMVASCLDYKKRQGGHGSIMLPILKNTQ